MIPAPRTVAGVTLLQSVALALPVLVTAWPTLPATSLVLAVAAMTAIAWEMIFAGIRKRPFSAHGAATALIITLFCPTDIAPWQLAFAVSLGVAFGELIFGGRGFGFVSPAALSLMLLTVAFPDITLHTTPPPVALAVFPGLALLLIMGLVSVFVLAGFGLGVLSCLAIFGQTVDPAVLAAALSVGAVFLVADPTSASTTPIGRWIYGGLAGAMVVVFSPTEMPGAEAIVAAALFASIFAPLIDDGAVRFHLWAKRRHG